MLHHLINGDEPEQYPIGVETQDFLTSVVFGNPFSADIRNWSVGLWFRVKRSPSIFWNRGSAFPGVSTEGLLLVIESTGSWHLFSRDEISATQGTNIYDTPVQSGSVRGIRTGMGEENTVSIATSGESGSLLFNGELIADLDLSMSVHAGDVIVLAGVLENDEFAGSATPFHSMVIADATGIQELVGDAGLGRLLAGQPELAFSGVTGDFVVNIDVPVVTPTFSGGWSWQAELNGQSNSIMLSIDSSKRLEIVEERLLESGAVEKTIVASTVLTEIANQVGVTNSIRILVVDGQVGFIINGLPIQGTAVDSGDVYDVTMRAFVRGETSTTGPIVSVDAIRLWQPVQETAAGAPGESDPAGVPSTG